MAKGTAAPEGMGKAHLIPWAGMGKGWDLRHKFRLMGAVAAKL